MAQLPKFSTLFPLIHKMNCCKHLACWRSECKSAKFSCIFLLLHQILMPLQSLGYTSLYLRHYFIHTSIFIVANVSPSIQFILGLPFFMYIFCPYHSLDYCIFTHSQNMSVLSQLAHFNFVRDWFLIEHCLYIFVFYSIPPCFSHYLPQDCHLCSNDISFMSTLHCP